MKSGIKGIKSAQLIAVWLFATVAITALAVGIHQHRLMDDRARALQARVDANAEYVSFEMQRSLRQVEQLSRIGYFKSTERRQVGPKAYPRAMAVSLRDFSAVGWYSEGGELLEGLEGLGDNEPELIDLSLFRTDVPNFRSIESGFHIWTPALYLDKPAILCGWKTIPLLNSDSGNEMIRGAHEFQKSAEVSQAPVHFPRNPTLNAQLQHTSPAPATFWLPFLLLPLFLLFPVALTLRLTLKEEVLNTGREEAGDRSDAERFEVVRKMAGGVAHDFRNFLTIILGNLSLLDRAGETERLELVNDATHAALMASDLAEDLMSLSDTTTLTLRSLPATKVLEDAKRLASKMLPFNVEILIDAEDDLGAVLVDATQLGRVFNNLIVNATHAMPNGGVITLSAVNVPDLPDMIEYCVADEGIGIPPEAMEHIFEPFYSTKGKKLGQVNGLGLYNAFAILQSHGGSIKCSSVQGEGAAFRLRVPRSPAGTQLSVEAGADSPHRLLVVDDEAAFRALTTELLTRSGYQVVTACNGKEAVDVCTQSVEDFDLILLDLKMPVLSGSKVFRLLRERGVTTPIVICTGFKDQMETFNVEAGDMPDGIVNKPFDFEVLVETVERVMNNDPRIRN